MVGTPTTNKATRSQTFMNLLKVAVGPGCLALPFAFSKAGLLLSTVILCTMSAMVYRNALMIVETKTRVRKQNPSESILSFGDIATRIIGPKTGEMMNVLLVSMQLGICTVYFRFMATNLHAAVPSLPEHTWMELTIPFMVMLALIRHLKSLAAFSTFANVATLITVMAVIGFSASWILDHGSASKEIEMAVFSETPVFFGIAIYSFEGCGAVLAIHDSMADPSEFRQAINQAGIVMFACFMLTGMVCYIAFGAMTNGSITAELGHRTHNHVLAILNLLIVLAVGLTYPIQSFAAFEVLEQKLGIRSGNNNKLQEALSGSLPTGRIKQIFFRIILVFITAIAAYSIPNLGQVVSLFGSVNGSVIALVLPPLLDLYSCPGATTLHRALNWITLVFGAVGGVAGTLVVVHNIVTGGRSIH
eukprot:m.11182 g.11182  ORF g.11182 m.11182 type:complete len:418 (+) comp4392_c0_seq1:289-1542(+)